VKSGQLVVLLAVVLPAVSLAGCGRTVKEDDCTHITENMRAAWAAEAKKATPSDPAGSEKAAAVVRMEGERLATDWTAECKNELMGHRVEPKELDCLLAATTLAAINKCSEP